MVHSTTSPVFRVTGGTETEITPTAAGKANSDGVVRYDRGSGRYTYNLKTKGWSRGDYRLLVELDDGTGHETTIELR